MEKLELKSGEQIDILSGASLSSIRIEVDGFDEFKNLKEKLTDDNLSEIKFYNSFEELCATYEDKTLVKNYPIEEVNDEDGNLIGLIVTFSLKDIDSTKQELKSLRETVNALVLANLEVE